MNRQESEKSSDPERLIARGLRATTPEFEARFDDLRRRLANEPRRRGVFVYIVDAMRGHPAWTVVSAVALVALAVVVVETRGPRGDATLIDETGWYAEVLALDDSLRGALVLTDPDALETLSFMPVDSSGGGS